MHVQHRLALGHLVRVVDADVVDASRVDVEALAQVLRGHGRALDVPAREAAAPRRVPLLLARDAGRGQLPEGEVGRVPLVLDALDPTTGGQLVEIEPRELRVAGEGRDVEVHAVGDHVGVASVLEGPHHRDLLGDVRRGLRQEVGLEAAQPTAVVGPLLGVELGDLRRRLAGRCGGLLHLVVTLVGIGHEVTDVGDVRDVGDVVAGRDEHPAQEVGEQLAAHVAEVLQGVDGGTARVDADLGRVQRLEPLHLAGARVVEAELLEPGGRPRRRGFGHPGIMADQTAATCTAW